MITHVHAHVCTMRLYTSLAYLSVCGYTRQPAQWPSGHLSICSYSRQPYPRGVKVEVMVLGYFRTFLQILTTSVCPFIFCMQPLLRASISHTLMTLSAPLEYNLWPLVARQWIASLWPLKGKSNIYSMIILLENTIHTFFQSNAWITFRALRGVTIL